MSHATALGSTLSSVFLRCEKAGLIHWNRAQMSQLGKRHYDDATRSDKPDDDDLLVHLDEYYHREQEMLSKRFKQNSDGDASVQGSKSNVGDTRTTTEFFLPMWKECFYRLYSASPQVQTINNSEDSADIDESIDIERKRELNRLRQRRFQARRRARRLHNEQVARNTFTGCVTAAVSRRDTYTKGKSVHDARMTSSVPSVRRLTNRARKYANSQSKKSVLNACGVSEARWGAEELDECVCTVCDRLVLRHKTCRIEDDNWGYMDKMSKALMVSRKTKLPGDLVAQYRAPAFVVDLEGVVVSPRGYTAIPMTWTPREYGFQFAMNAIAQLNSAGCQSFRLQMARETMWGLTLPERFMTQLVSIVALTRVMRGGRHRCIRSYCIAFDSSPGPPILLLPRSIEYVASFRVVLVGEFTPSPSSKVRKMHRIRNLKVRDMIKF
ncbi:hypothetical protein GQ600_16878 [Phytophthora cactorum]|nr:hypothetical protein GQ600_16878 [Phytophthora cactorum]